MGLPKIRYNGKIIDFNKKPINIQRGNSRKIVVNSSSSDIEEILELSTRETISASWQFEQPQIANHELLRFWEYARSGNTFALWLDKDIGLFLGFDGTTLITNDGQTGIINRNGAAYRINPFTNFLESVASGQPRFESGQFGQALLIESDGVNYCQRSSEFDNAAWSKSLVTVTADITYLKDPEGNNIADRLDFTGTGSLRYTTSTVISSNDLVSSVWLCSLDKNETVTINIGDDLGPVIATTDVTVTPEWQRFEISGTGGTGGNYYFTISATNGVSVFAWGVQMEIGRLVASSYMPGSGVNGTRNTEYSTVALNSNDINPMQGSISCWIYPYFKYNESTNKRFIVLKDSTTGYDFLRIYKDSTINLVTLIALADDLSTVSASVVASFLTEKTWHFITVTWDGTISNGLKLYHNGILKNTSTNNPSLFLQNVDTLYLGDNSAYNFDGRLDDVLLWKKVLSVSEIANIYGLGKSQGIGKNYYKELLLNGDVYMPTLRPGHPLYEFSINAREYKR